MSVLDVNGDKSSTLRKGNPIAFIFGKLTYEKNGEGYQGLIHRRWNVCFVCHGMVVVETLHSSDKPDFVTADNVFSKTTGARH